MNNVIRTFVLMGVLTFLFVWIGGELGGRNGAIIAFFVAAGINFFAYWFSDKMVLKRYRAAEVTPESQPQLHQMVSDLAQRANLPKPKVYLINDSSPNAFATGRNPQNAAVAATTGILSLLDQKELSGVMAHELAHVKHRDILTGTIAATLAGAIAMMTQFVRYGGGSQSRNKNPIMLLLIMIGIPLIATLIRLAISRVREYEADRGGAEISGEPLGLANALAKLQQGVQKKPLTNGNPAHAHMFIVNPFLGGVQKLFSTHPPAEERIRRLKEMATRQQAT